MSYYAQVINGEITRINVQLPTVIGNTSIPANCADVAEFNLYPITGSEPTYNPATQRLSGPTYAFTGSEVARAWAVEDIPAEELAASFIATVTDATQARLDDFAKTRNYDGILSACTYASSTIPKFQVEGQYCVNSRDATWAVLYTLMGEVQAGTRPMPGTVADVLSLLPELSWPAT